jgi:Mn-dependent DtxR family transcriptional regulator
LQIVHFCGKLALLYRKEVIPMAIQESGEMYLETIHVLSKKNGQVRSIDISEHMGYSKPSVSRAMGLLKEGGYITIDKEGFITLTDSGLEVAEKIYERHTILSNLLVALGVSPETAAEDACKIEHAISDESFEAIKQHSIQYGRK